MPDSYWCRLRPMRLTWSHSAANPWAPSASARFTTPRSATKPLAPSACARVTWSHIATKSSAPSISVRLTGSDSATKPSAPSACARLTRSHSATKPWAYSRTVRPRSRPSTCCSDAEGRQYHSHPDEDAVKKRGPETIVESVSKHFFSDSLRNKLERKRRTFEMDAYARRSDQGQPQSVISRSARTPSRRGPKTLLKFCCAWIVLGRRPSALELL